MTSIRRDILLIAIGAFLSTVIEAASNLANALEYPRLFFPAGASLINYEWTQVL